MANLRGIRQRISGVKSTSKITQAMKLVAAAKLRRAQEAVVSSRPYAYHLRDLMGHLIQRVDKSTLPLLFGREERHAILIVVVTADRGLCGPFNTNIIKAATQRIHQTYGEEYRQGKIKVVCIGRRGYQYFVKRDYDVIGKHLGVTGNASLTEAKLIVTEILEGFTHGSYDKVEVIYNEFKSVVQQNLRVEQLLPIPQEELQHTGKHYNIDYIYEPSELELLEHLFPKHLNYQILRILLESNAAEQGARMTAMDAATTNAKDLIHTLQLEYNRARQSNITKEILEIVSGAEALSKG